MNFGAIGAVIGHEIGHGFDDQGSRYDGEGNLSNWWTEEDRAAFEERTHALIGQYDVLTPSVLLPTEGDEADWPKRRAKTAPSVRSPTSTVP